MTEINSNSVDNLKVVNEPEEANTEIVSSESIEKESRSPTLEASSTAVPIPEGKVEDYKVLLPLLTTRSSPFFESLFGKKPINRNEFHDYITSQQLNVDDSIKGLKENGFLLESNGKYTWNKKFRLIVIGCGFSARTLTRTLDKKCNNTIEMTIISMYNYFESRPAIPIVSAAPHKVNTFRKPLRKYIHHANIITAKVEEIDLQGHIHYTGESTGTINRWDYDAVVVATGSECLMDPLGIDTSNEETIPIVKGNQMSEFVEENAERWNSYSTIALIGGGPTALEIGFELAYKYKNTEFIFITKSGWLPKSPDVHNKVEKFASRFKNVTIYHGYQVNKISGRKIFANGQEKGNLELEADVAIACIGVKPCTKLLPKELLNEQNFVQVHQNLNSTVWEHLYALADITSIKDGKSAAHGSVTADTLAKSLQNLASGKNKLIDYEIPKHVALLSMGPNIGLLVSSGRVKFSGYLMGKIKQIVERGFMF